MAELRDSGSDTVYRPLSFLALAGFAISCLFGGVVVLSAVLAIIQGAPFFFHNGVLLVAVVGFVVAWLGLNEIRNSEDTKAGRTLAVSGMWISLATGAAYFAYSYFTGLALQQQALAFFLRDDNEFSGWFPRLQRAGRDKVEFYRAFLLTMPYSARTARPEDGDKIVELFDRPTADGATGRLTRFKTDHSVMSLVKGGDQAHVEPLGVKEWVYEKGSYRVTCAFRIKSLEGTADLTITAVSTEGESDRLPRFWFADLTSAYLTNMQPTPLGRGLEYLRTVAVGFLGQLENEIRQASWSRKPPPRDGTDWTKQHPDDAAELKDRIRAIFDGKAPDQGWHINSPSKLGLTDWDRDAEGRVVFKMPLALVFVDTNSDVLRAADLQTVVRTKTPIDPERIVQSDRPVAPEWELLEYQFLRLKKNKK
ncbi:MAG: hypothetical protein NZO58_05290 [Gemmataceae bacterium]|nr:hypothetical protein [Gemmataceae bacterium]